MVGQVAPGRRSRDVLAGAFNEACGHGHMVVAQCLMTKFEVHGLTVDVVSSDAFVLACSRGHLDVAKWLLAFGAVDIHHGVFPVLDWPFEVACQNGHFGIARWLLTLEPDEAYKWPCLEKLKVWSAPRDAWMRGVAKTCRHTQHSTL